MKDRRHPRAVAWVVGALALAPIELMALGSGRPTLAWTATTLLAGLGLVCGAVIAGQARLARALELGAWGSAGVRALPAALPFALVAVHLFDGGMAATLPGASWGVVWVPVVGTALIGVALHVGGRMLARPAGRPAVIFGLALMTAAIEYANRGFLVSEYPDVHAFLTLAAVVTAGMCLHLAGLAELVRRLGHGRAVAAIATAVIVASTVLVSVHGLARRDDRWIVATRGAHTRHMVRLMRAAMDRDDDGYAGILGGGDCDEGDAAVHPAAVDVPENGRDEDCDGADAVRVVRSAERVDRERALAAWRARPDVTAALQAMDDYHVVLIAVDALRADILAPTDANRAAYPNMHALADQSRRFARAFSPAAGTDVALAALLTGRINPFVMVPTTLLEALSRSGRVTHAVIPREVLRWAGKTLITRGLNSYDRLITDRGKRDVGNRSTGWETTDLGVAFLDRHARSERADAPVFLWLHYFDVHEHHQLETADARFAAVLGGDTTPDRPRKYRAAAELVDAEVGRVMAELRARGMWDRTIVILLSDHGESLGEDPRLPDAHGRYLYNPLVHVPLLIRVPGVPPATIDQPVSLIDAAPTLLALVGAAPLPGADGGELVPYVLAGTPAGPPAEALEWPRALVLNESDQYGVIAWPYKLLVRPGDNLIELYDLNVDFAERSDLSVEHPQIVQRLKNLYGGSPPVRVDRTLAGRQEREALAQPPRRTRVP